MTVTQTTPIGEAYAKEICAQKGYRYIHFIGRGGMGEVFKVKDASGQRLALKILTDPMVKVVFSYEMKALRDHGNPYVVAMRDWGEERCCWYLMDYYPQNLAGWIASHPDPSSNREQGLGFFGQALVGLAGWHRGSCNTVCHGDINPSNILLDEIANHAVLSDPSLASIRGPHGTNYTTDRPRGGTPGYQDPSPDTAGRPSGDVYQAGATLYALLARRTELPANNLTDTVESDSTIPTLFKEVVLGCLNPDLSKRYRDAWELQKAFEAAKRTVLNAGDAGEERWTIQRRKEIVRAAETIALVLTIVTSLYTLKQAFELHARALYGSSVQESRRGPSVSPNPSSALTSRRLSARPVIFSSALSRLNAPSAQRIGKNTPMAATLLGSTNEALSVRPTSAWTPLDPQGHTNATHLPARSRDEGDYHKSIGHTRRPQTSDYLTLGDVSQQNGDFREAARLFNLAIRIRPLDPAPHRALGLLFRHIHNDAGARDQLHQYLLLAPQAPDRQEIQRMIQILHR